MKKLAVIAAIVAAASGAWAADVVLGSMPNKRVVSAGAGEAVFVFTTTTAGGTTTTTTAPPTTTTTTSTTTSTSTTSTTVTTTTTTTTTAANDWTSDFACVGAWLMAADGSTAENDVSGDGNHLTISASDTIPQTNAVPSGYSGYARDWEDGDQDYMYRLGADVSAGMNAITNELSVVLWMRAESSGTLELVQHAGTTTGTYKWILQTLSDNRVRLGLSEDGTNYSYFASSASAWTNGVWRHVAVTFDAPNSEVKYYFDGSLDETDATTVTRLYQPTAAIAVGRFFDGLLDETAVFSRVLTSSEIEEIYTYGIDGSNGGND